MIDMCVRYITDHVLHPGLPDACVALKQEVTEQLFMLLYNYAALLWVCAVKARLAPAVVLQLQSAT